MKKVLLLFGVILFNSNLLFSLNPGDIAFVDYCADGTDQFSFVALVNIPGDEIIFLTDKGWDGSVLSSSEGTIQWTAPSAGVAAGTVVTIITNVPAVDVGTVVESGSFSTSGGGDQILVYQSCDEGSSLGLVFLTAIDMNGGFITSGTITTNTSYLPPGLSLGTNAIEISPETDNAVLNISPTDVQSNLLSSINDVSNWTPNNTSCTAYTGTITVNAAVAGEAFDLTPMTSTGNATINFSAVATPSNGVDVNTLDDAYIDTQEATTSCTDGQYDLSYGSFTASTDGSGTGSISGLVDNNENVIDNVTLALYEVPSPCADIGIIGEPLMADGSVPTTSSGLQDAAPTPSDLTATAGLLFTENVGSSSSSGRNQLCIDFTASTTDVMMVSFWLGDVETSDATPGYVFVYDETGALLENGAIPTSTPVADQATTCVGNTAQDTGGECGNDETVFVDISATIAIGMVCIQVGDFPGDNGASEHLSIGGVATGGVCNLILPVELRAFKGYVKSKNTVLEWFTASEKDNAYFDIEHSINGQDFHQIGSVDGAGTSQATHSYRFVHESPQTGDNYYRLRQVDFSGAYALSEVINLHHKGTSTLSIRPTKAKHTIELIASEPSTHPAQLEIFDVAGRKVMSRNVPAGTLQLALNIEYLDDGHYFVRLTNTQFSENARFIKY